MKSDSSPEFNAFRSLVKSVLGVPHAEIKRREAEYKKQADKNPRKRGPKKAKVSDGNKT